MQAGRLIVPITLNDWPKPIWPLSVLNVLVPVPHEVNVEIRSINVWDCLVRRSVRQHSNAGSRFYMQAPLSSSVSLILDVQKSK